MASRLEKKLHAVLEQLTPEQAESVLAFAEFLRQREVNTQTQVPPPVPIPRPEKESVVKAIKRLSATYPMIDRAKMLNETSILMSQHVMQGRDAVEVIDELQVLFEGQYEKLRQGD